MKRRPYPQFWRSPGLMFEGFPVSPDDIVIDVGCGDGTLICGCAEAGAKVIATDVRTEIVDAVSKRLTASGANFEAFVSDAGPLPLPDASVTRVISTQVIEHVDNPYLFLAELVRIGRPGALYLLAAPDLVGEYLVKRIAHPAAFEKPHHVRIIERGEFADMVTNAGLVIEYRAFQGFSDLLSSLIFWVDEDDKSQLLRQRWEDLWDEVVAARLGPRLETLLDGALPKDQIIVARKPG